MSDKTAPLFSLKGMPVDLDHRRPPETRPIATRTIPAPSLRMTPHGPILPGRRPHRRAKNSHLYIPALDQRQRLTVGVLTGCWIAAFIAFWIWWIQPQHNAGWFGMILNSVMVFYLWYLPAYFLFAVNRLRKIDPSLPVPNLRTAFVVTKAPSEPWAIAEKTLKAMLAQRFPHDYDVWLCDEDPSAAVLDWCEQHDVKVSTRRGVREYHRPEWPRRTRCKEGNLAYFYDHWGYRDYDVVAQLDCDHVPEATYLTEVLRPFIDPNVGYVAAPSVCDSNAATSWSARGRLHKEGTFHGPFQMGHVGGLAPLCIGSHYAVRTAALREIGGLGPELAEDFSTAFLLSSAGWQGSFAHNAEAHGEGPHTFAAKATQEFQWSRSLMMLLLNTLPHHIGRFSWSLRLRFLLSITYYPLLALVTAVGLSLPAIAVITSTPWVNVSYPEFLLRGALITVWLMAVVFMLRRWGLLRPWNAPLLSWENSLYSMSRWPFIIWGVSAAVIQKFRPTPVGFRVTPKAKGGFEPLKTHLMLPFATVSVLMSTVALIGQSTSYIFGYVFLCLLGSAMYALVTLVVPLLHAWESARATSASMWQALRATAGGPLSVSAVVWIPLILASASFPDYLAYLFPDGVPLTW